MSSVLGSPMVAREEPLVTLCDGRRVSSYSHEWASECLERHSLVCDLATLPGRANLEARRSILGRIEVTDGAEMRRRVEAELLKVWSRGTAPPVATKGPTP